MSLSPPLLSSRRAILAAFGLAAMAGIGLPLRAGAAPAKRRVVTILGDSITAGYGLRAQDALPAQLEAALARLGANAEVRGAGLSGDTTGGGLARLDFSVQSDSSVCVVELGGNDVLQGLPPVTTRANLDRILARLKARGIRTVLCGLSAPSSLSVSFARDFNRIYPDLARRHGVALYPNLLAGVAMTAGLNQADGLHPNPRGVKIIAARLAPVVAHALNARA